MIPFLAIGAFVLLLAGLSSKVIARVPHEFHILLVGDSEVQAVLPAMQSLAGMNERLDASFKVGSRIEAWSQGLMAHALAPFGARQPQIVVIMLGTNNFSDTATPDVEPILTQLRNINARCVWVGPTSVHGLQWPVNDFLLASVVGSGCSYVNTQTLGIELADGVHPTAAGARKWAGIIWDAVRRAEASV